MTDWIEHNGGPQPVGDDVWVDVGLRDGRYISGIMAGAVRPVSKAWPVDIVRYRILNQHLIDAARREGIRLGLEAAARLAQIRGDEWEKAEYGNTLCAIAFHRYAKVVASLDPATIAKEAQHD